MLAEGEDAESDKLEFGVCGCVGLLAQGGGEAQEIMAGTAGGFGNLEKDLVDKGSGEVGEGEGGDGAEDADFGVLDVGSGSSWCFGYCGGRVCLIFFFLLHMKKNRQWS